MDEPRLDCGFIILSRSWHTSELWMRKPAEWLKITAHIYLSIAYKGSEKGTRVFHWETERRRLPGISMDQWKRCVRYLREAHWIESRTTGRGLWIRWIGYEQQTDIHAYGSADTKTKPPADAPTTPAQPTYSPEFLAFWNEIPDGRRVSKQQAAVEFRKAVANGADPGYLKDQMRKYAATVRGTELKFIKRPNNWLRDGLWQDEYDQKPKPKPRPTAGIDDHAIESYCEQARSVESWRGKENPLYEDIDGEIEDIVNRARDGLGKEAAARVRKAAADARRTNR